MQPAAAATAAAGSRRSRALPPADPMAASQMDLNNARPFALGAACGRQLHAHKSASLCRSCLLLPVAAAAMRVQLAVAFRPDHPYLPAAIRRQQR